MSDSSGKWFGKLFKRGSEPVDAAAWNRKGNSLDNSGRSEEAIFCFDKALELDPRRGGTWYNKGNSLKELGQPEKALLCLDQALELDSSSIEIWCNKGNFLDDLHRPEEAIRSFEQALKLDLRRAYDSVLWAEFVLGTLPIILIILPVAFM